MTIRRTVKKTPPKTLASFKDLSPYWLKVGAVVELVSGSFPMTVTSLHLAQGPNEKDTIVTVNWADSRNYLLHVRDLNSACLRPFQPPCLKDEDIPF